MFLKLNVHHLTKEENGYCLLFCCRITSQIIKHLKFDNIQQIKKKNDPLFCHAWQINSNKNRWSPGVGITEFQKLQKCIGQEIEKGNVLIFEPRNKQNILKFMENDETLYNRLEKLVLTERKQMKDADNEPSSHCKIV